MDLVHRPQDVGAVDEAVDVERDEVVEGDGQDEGHRAGCGADPLGDAGNGEALEQGTQDNGADEGAGGGHGVPGPVGEEVGAQNRDGAKRRAGTSSRLATARKIALSAASDTNCTADLQDVPQWNRGCTQRDVTTVACQRDLGHSTLATTVAGTYGETVVPASLHVGWRRTNGRS